MFYIEPLETKEFYKIGRDIKKELVLENCSISRNHAEIQWKNNKFFIFDNNSKFGTVKLVRNLSISRLQGRFLLIDKFKLSLHYIPSNKRKCSCLMRIRKFQMPELSMNFRFNLNETPLKKKENIRQEFQSIGSMKVLTSYRKNRKVFKRQRKETRVNEIPLIRNLDQEMSNFLDIKEIEEAMSVCSELESQYGREEEELLLSSMLGSEVLESVRDKVLLR